MTEPRQKALFLDRDGVINEERGHIHRPEDFVFRPGIFDALRRARAAGYLLIVVTNQSGIGRGLFAQADFDRLNDWMLARLAEQDIDIAAVYHDPTHPTEGVGDYRRASPNRKPAPGMILDAARDHGLDLAASVLVGDQESDIEAGRAAGVGITFLVAATPPAKTRADHVVSDLAEAVRTFCSS